MCVCVIITWEQVENNRAQGRRCRCWVIKQADPTSFAHASYMPTYESVLTANSTLTFRVTVKPQCQIYELSVSTVLRVPQRHFNRTVISGWFHEGCEVGRGSESGVRRSRRFLMASFLHAQTKENSQGRAAYWNLITGRTYFCPRIYQNQFKNNNPRCLLRMLLSGGNVSEDVLQCVWS